MKLLLKTHGSVVMKSTKFGGAGWYTFHYIWRKVLIDGDYTSQSKNQSILVGPQAPSSDIYQQFWMYKGKGII